jgi:acetyl esterase/lipase
VHPTIHFISRSFCLLAIFAASAQAQIRIVAGSPGSNDVALGASYVQNFNTLPVSGPLNWADNSTLPGWYANLTAGQVSTGNMVATGINAISAVTVGAVGGSATLNSLGSSGSTGRALGGTPSAFTTGAANIFSSQSVNVVLRLKNSTGGVLTGMKVAYDTVATATGNKDAVAFAYRVFSAGSGTISTNFIETHRYLNPYNGTYDESMRTEFGRRVSSTSGWTCVVKDIAPTSGSNRTDSLAFTLKDLSVNPGDEVWLAWHICKEDEQGASDPVTTTGIDNVTINDFTVGRPGLPIITTHPRSLAVATGGTRDFTLSVEAKGGALTYQWRKDGVDLNGANSATYTAVNVNGTAEGIYDCVVSTAGGSVTSLPAKVNIYARVAVTTVNDVSFDSYSSGISQLRAATGGTLADLYYPSTLTPGSPDVPAVIVIHGGGGNNGDKQDSREVEAAQELAARGWFVISINYAMSSSTVQCWPYNLWDAKQAVRWLKQQADAGTYAIDKTRIGVVGFSWGCNMGSMLAMTGPADDVGVSSAALKVEPPVRGDAYDSYSTAVQCSAVFYGAADLPNYHQMNQFLDKTAWSDRTTYRRASPIRYPNPSAAPMLVVHGSADDDVWQSQTESTYLMQRSVGATLENYLQVPGGEHSFGLYETAKIAAGFSSPIDVRPETIGFMEKYLIEPTQRTAIIVEPLSSIVNAGSNATFSVQATGSPAPTFQWRKNGVNLGGATQASYPVVASSGTAGYYDVIITNSVGSVVSTAGLLTVLGSSTNLPPAAVATIESGTNAGNDIDEATLGYVSTKFSATGTKRKAYFQFDLGSLSVSAAGTATFTLNFTNSFLQNVQLWALNQSYAGFTSGVTWNGAQANNISGNGMLTGATAIGTPRLIPSAYPNAETFSIPNIVNYVLDGKVTLVLTGVDDVANNSSGGRFNRTNASLLVPVTATPAQSWWFQKFGTTDLSAAPHSAGADSDNDGGANLLEYSQGSNPLLADHALWLPVTTLTSNLYRFTYRKSGPDLSYQVQRNSTLNGSSGWLAVSSPEVDNGNGTYSIEAPASSTADFFRLKVTAP